MSPLQNPQSLIYFVIWDGETVLDYGLIARVDLPNFVRAMRPDLLIEFGTLQ